MKVCHCILGRENPEECKNCPNYKIESGRYAFKIPEKEKDKFLKEVGNCKYQTVKLVVENYNKIGQISVGKYGHSIGIDKCKLENMKGNYDIYIKAKDD